MLTTAAARICGLVCNDGTAHPDYLILSCGGAYQVLPRLLLWSVQTALSKDQIGELAGHYTGCQQLSSVQLCPTCLHRRWYHCRSCVRLVIFFCLRKLPGLKNIHHFRFPSSDPGVVYVKTHSDEEEVKFTLLKKSSKMSPDPSEYPEPGADLENVRLYLFEPQKTSSAQVIEATTRRSL